MVYVGSAELYHGNYNPCFPSVHQDSSLSLVPVGPLICPTCQNTFYMRLSCELSAPIYKKRMYNRVQIERAEVGEDAGMRGRTT